MKWKVKNITLSFESHSQEVRSAFIIRGPLFRDYWKNAWNETGLVLDGMSAGWRRIQFGDDYA